MNGTDEVGEGSDICYCEGLNFSWGRLQPGLIAHAYPTRLKRTACLGDLRISRNTDILGKAEIP